jgi:CTD small phosphatase-like protein 2
MIHLTSLGPRKTLILDLDETLIHLCGNRAEDNENGVKPDVYLTLKEENGEKSSIGIKIRPHAFTFLETVSKYFEVIVFTASSPSYAYAVVDHLDPHHLIIKEILTRGNCHETRNRFFIKDLRIIQNRDLKDMVIVDNLVHSFGLQIDNGIPILEWTDDPNDEELAYLPHYLIALAQVDDVRPFNKEHLRLSNVLSFTEKELCQLVNSTSRTSVPQVQKQ